MPIKTRLFCFISIFMPMLPVYADIIIGPGAVSGPVSVTTQATSIIGSTTVTATGTNAGANVTGSILTLDSLLGPSPGLIVVQTNNGNALNANGGSIKVLNNVLLTTIGGHAVLANGSASNVTLTGTSIQTTGTGAGLVAIGGIIEATGVLINNLGNSTVNVSAGHGAIAESGGTIQLNAGSSVTTGAFNSVGLGASGNGSHVITTSIVPIIMNGRGAMAIYLHDGGQVQLADGSILQLNASNSIGVTADNTTVASNALGKGLIINFNAIPTVGQAGGTGIVAINGGNISLDQVTVQGVGAGAGAWAQANSTINLTGNSVINVNSNANPTFYTLATPYLATANGQIGSIFNVTSGLPIGGLLSKGGTINSTGTIVNVSSNNGVGAYAASTTTSIINMINNTINTTGNSSFGIEAGENGRIAGVNTNVTTTGGGAALFLFAFNGYGSINLANSTIHALGPNTTGLASLNLSSNLTNVATLNTSYLTSEEQPVILAVGGPLAVNATQSTLTAQNGLLIDSIFNVAAAQQSSVVLASSQSLLTGNAHADSQSVVNMNLSNASFWSGASLDATNISLDSTSTWSVTESSNITQQLANSGLILFTPPSPEFKTVTTHNYLGAGGIIAINTYLGGDNSPSDQLVINGGSATGTTSLFVTNTTGPGALTVANGILVINTINGGTTSGDAFSLANPGSYVAAGPYAYTLFRGSKDASNPDAWYLRSTLNCPPGSTDPLCNNPRPDEESNFRPEVSLYTALPSMALFFGQALLDTLHERVGDEEDLKHGTRINRSGSGTWGRIIGQHGKNNGDNLGIYGTGPEFNYNLGAIQLGHDVYRGESDKGRRDHIGVYGAGGHLSGEAIHITTQRSAGDDTLTNYSIGGYWTHFWPSGGYLDGVVQGSWYDAKATPLYLPALRTDGEGVAASLEGGYPFAYQKNTIIEPQAQLIYEEISFGKGSDTAATVKFRNVNSLLGRLGIRFAKTWQWDKNVDYKRVIAWVRPNFWYNFQGSSKTLFSYEGGYLPFVSEIGGSWLGINLGVNAKLTEAVSLFANGTYDNRITGSASYAYNGKLGIRTAW